MPFKTQTLLESSLSDTSQMINNYHLILATYGVLKVTIKKICTNKGISNSIWYETNAHYNNMESTCDIATMVCGVKYLAPSSL